MIRRSISCMLAGTLAAFGLDLWTIFLSDSPRAVPGGFILVAGWLAGMGLTWLVDEIAGSGLRACTHKSPADVRIVLGNPKHHAL
jgi:hypothetical protein